MKNSKKPTTPEELYLIELEEKRKKDALKSYLNSGHRVPNSRREFLASGMLSVAGMIAVPSLLQLIGNRANAAGLSSECAKLLTPTGGWTPYIHVYLGGGAALHSNLFPLDKMRQLLPSYDRVGLGTLSNFTVTNGFGNVPLAMKNGKYIGQLMQGLMDTAGASAINKTALVKFAVRSQDDSPANRDSIMGLVNRLGLQGSDFPNLIANTGKLRNPSALYPATAPQAVVSASGILSSLAPGGRLTKVLINPAKRDSLLKLVSGLNTSQRKKLGTSASAESLGQLMECSSSKNVELADADLSGLDPRNDNTVASIWGIDSSTVDNDRQLVHAVLAYNVLNGKSGAGRIDLGGYDYHGSTRAEQNAKDLDGGQVIGRLLKTAEAMGKPLFIHVTSDGSVEGRSDGADGNYASDAGARGMGAFITYSPTGRPATSDSQIGHFNTSQSVDETFINTWTAERSAIGVFANYLQLHKRMDLLEQLAPGQFDMTTLNKLVKIV